MDFHTLLAVDDQVDELGTSIERSTHLNPPPTDPTAVAFWRSQSLIFIESMTVAAVSAHRLIISML